MELLEGESEEEWRAHQQALEAHSEKIADSQDIVEQRQQFGLLSTTLIQALQQFGLKDRTLYVQHCPMSFDNTGADWLSLEKEILNPYFGDEMLTCGYVTGELGKIKNSSR